MRANREGECPDKEWREWRDHIRSDALFVSEGALFMSLNLGSLRSTFSFQFTEEGTEARGRGAGEAHLPKTTCLVRGRGKI